MNIFITATDTDAGKTYVSKGIVTELLKRGKKTAYFKPFQSGIVENILSDADTVSTAKNTTLLTTKNSYITKTPCTPSISAKIDNINIDIEKVKKDYKELEKNHDIVITEGSGGLFVPVNDKLLMSDIIKELHLPCIVVARPNLGTINHTLLTLCALKSLNIDILGIVISNYPKNSKDPCITTAPKLIEEFSKKLDEHFNRNICGTKILDIINHNENDFEKIVDEILKN